jgi:hypothetical protein
VGPSNVIFLVHEPHACYYSRLISQKVTEWKAGVHEQSEQITIHLPKADGDLFEKFHRWIYAKTIFQNADFCFSETDQPEGVNALLYLHSLGEYLQSPGFINTTIDCHFESCQSLLKSGTIIECWKRSSPDSSLRRLVLDHIIYNSTKYEFQQYIKELLPDIVQEVAIAMKAKFDGDDKKWQKRSPKDYHIKED